MVARVETIKKKIKQGKKLGFSERARAVNKGILPSKAKKKKKKWEREMQIIDNKALLLRLRDPDKVINAIPKSKAVGNN